VKARALLELGQDRVAPAVVNAILAELQ